MSSVKTRIKASERKAAVLKLVSVSCYLVSQEAAFCFNTAELSSGQLTLASRSVSR